MHISIKRNESECLGVSPVSGWVQVLSEQVPVKMKMYNSGPN